MRTTSKGLTSKIQHCTECEEKIEPIWKDLPQDAETWFWLECDECGEYMCKSCECVVGDDGEERYCPTCYSGKKIRGV